jgi:opacity protein-like surface antigen
MSYLVKNFMGILAVVVICLSVASAAVAQEDEKYYLRISGVNQCVSGDFSGDWLGDYTDADIYVIIPKLDRATGYGLTFGGQRGRLFGELSYSYTEHDSKFFNSDTVMKFELDQTVTDKINFDCKYALVDPEEFSFIPYGLIGVSYEFYRVKNGAAKIESISVTAHDDAKFRGCGGELGVGFMLKFNANLGLDASYAVNRTWLERVKAFGETRDPNMKVDTQTFNFSLNYYF